ncbi:MAG: amidohydrolase family protein [Pseudomonadota bacterium]
MRTELQSLTATLLAATALTLAPAASALTPPPAADQAEPIAITNVTVHVGNGEVIADATVAFGGGRITAVGTGVDTAGHRVIDGGGQHLYPGFVLPDSRLGLEEVSSIEDTKDGQETGQVNPNVRSLIAYNTDSEMGPTLRFNGVLVAQVAPTGGLVSGSSSIVQLDAWNWEDAVISADDAIFVNWPPKRQGRFDFSTFTFKFEENKQYDTQMLAMETLFNDASTYTQRPAGTPSNLKLAAMQGLYSGDTRLFVRTDVARDAVRAVEFASRHGVQHVVIVGDEGLLAAADYLAEHQVGVIVMGTHRLPGEAHHDIHAPYAFAGQLVAAGVKAGLTVGGLFNTRNLPFHAGTAGAHGGLDREQTLRLITLSNAELLGIDDRVGSIAVGKEATLFVSKGDALDMRTNQLSHAFIAGRALTLGGTQQELYERFREKYSSTTAAP